MTRETKIGLLVGLAFIIVVAILLTDHTTTTTDPKPAAQSDIGDNVRQSVATPQQPIPTRADLERKREPARPPVVQVGPDTSAPPISIAPVEIPRGNGLPPIVLDSAARGEGRSNDLVSRYPDELMAVGGMGQSPANTPNGASASGTSPNGTTPARPTPPPVVPPKTYVADTGDSVSRIASKMMGGNTKANRDALIKANPSLQAEGNPVMLGKTYIIPSAGAVAQAEQPRNATGGASAASQPQPFKKPSPTAPNTYWYTVKENDNLWRIAEAQLGNGNLWLQIKDMNADVLKGGETVRANQRIRLPRAGGSTASVN